ncbi:hypothetical protein TNCV_1418751 [Trichonephila clavipes]|nr:hypothetical protein TNCV_1418751 [Trichonephila clavipes]
MCERVHSSQFALSNSTPSLGELTGSISVVQLLIRNLLGSKSTLIRGSQVSLTFKSIANVRPLIEFSLVKICPSFLTVTHRLCPLISCPSAAYSGSLSGRIV